MNGVSIVFNLYQPDKKVLARVLDSFSKQETKYPVEIIVVDKKTDEVEKKIIKKFSQMAKKIKTKTIRVDPGLSFASSMNVGLKVAKYDKLVVIQQDCIPSTNTWLDNLVKPLEKKEIVSATSKVIYPDELWNSMDLFTKSIMLNEKGTITPGSDEKACAYKKQVFQKLGFFNEKEFKTAGEDYDLYIKLKREGVIAYPNASVYHYHPIDFDNKIKKIKQYANGFGTLFRKNGTKLPRWYSGILKAIPFLGILGFILAFPYRKGVWLFPTYLLLTPILHWNYIQGFWKGFFRRKQEIDVFVKRK